MKDGKIRFERGYGLADIEHEAKITPSTVFNVGSIAKPLHGDGDPDARTGGQNLARRSDSEVHPRAAGFGNSNHLARNAASHRRTSRLSTIGNFDGWRLDSPDLLTNGDVHVHRDASEGSKSPTTDFGFAYSNTNYVLLAEVVSRVSKQSFPDFTMTRLPRATSA